MPKVIVGFPKPLLEEMDTEARNLQMSRSEFLRLCCREKVKRHREEKLKEALLSASDSNGMINCERVIELLGVHGVAFVRGEGDEDDA